MTNDFYCEEVLSGHTPVKKVLETDNFLAYYHTKSHWPVHIVITPKRHIDSLLTLEEQAKELIPEMISIIRQVASVIISENGSCRIITNLGNYQDSKHLHWHIVSGKEFLS